MAELIPFDEITYLFDDFEHTAWRLETRRAYRSDEETETYRRFIRGEDAGYDLEDPWCTSRREQSALGKRFERVRLVDNPPTQGQLYLLDGARRNSAVGEDIRNLWRTRAEQLKLPAEDLEKSSRRLQRTYDRIKQLRATATRRATDWQHRTTTYLARTYGVIVVEQLDITNMVKSARGTIEEPGKNVRAKAGLNRSIAQEAWGRTVTMLTYKLERHGGELVKVPAPNTSLRCSACGFITPGSRENQAMFVCKNPDCRWSGNADWNASRNILHLYRIGLVAVPAAGRAVVRRSRSVKPPTAR